MAHDDRRTSSNLILEAAEELHNLEQLVTRDSLAQHTGLKPGIIDDRLKVLVGDGRLVRVERGVYMPLAPHKPARQISHTELPDGTVVLDIGDEVMHLTPKEARTLGAMLGARALQATQIELGNQAGVMVTELAAKIRRLEREVRGLRSELKGDNEMQLGLDIQGQACRVTDPL